MPQLTCSLNIDPAVMLTNFVDIYKECTRLSVLLEKRFPRETHIYTPRSVQLINQMTNAAKARLGKPKAAINLNHLLSDINLIRACVGELDPFSVHE